MAKKEVVVEKDVLFKSLELDDMAVEEKISQNKKEEDRCLTFSGAIEQLLIDKTKIGD